MDDLQAGGESHVLVASSSRIKLDAVKAAFANCVVTGVPAASDINEQPLGHDETIRGAMNRLANAKQSEAYTSGVAAYAVSIENGIFSVTVPGEERPRWFDLAWVVVEHVRSGSKALAHSMGLEFPAKYVDAAQARGFDTCTAGSVMAAETGCEKNDPHAWLTHQGASRSALLVEALKLALYQLPSAP